MTRSKNKVILILLLTVLLPLFSFSQTEPLENLIPVDEFYQYDKKMLLNAKEEIKKETDDYIQYHITYDSVNDKKVTANLIISKKGTPPYPVVIYQHGMSESKDTEQVLFGTERLVKNGFAVFSIDADHHGERTKEKDFVVNTIAKGNIYTMRNIFIQTVIDIRRGMDYLAKKKSLDKEKIGYVGISMGGIIGTIISAVDERIKAPIFIVAGGNFTKMVPIISVAPHADKILKTIDPIYFAKRISPRPLLMINGLQDYTINEAANDLYNSAQQPKKIIWIDDDHIGVPLREDTIKHCGEFLRENLK